MFRILTLFFLPLFHRTTIPLWSMRTFYSRLESIIGPFCTSLLNVIPKPGLSKFCLIQDHSFPQDDSLPSINSMINSSLFQCDWGTFSDCWLIVALAPPESQAAIFNVEVAHRHSPITPEDQYLVCTMFTSDDITQIYLNHCACFGSSSSNGLFGCPVNAISSIYIHRGVDKLLCWSNDFAFFCFPAVCFLFLNSLPLQLIDPLTVLTLIWPLAVSLQQLPHLQRCP